MAIILIRVAAVQLVKSKIKFQLCITEVSEWHLWHLYGTKYFQPLCFSLSKCLTVFIEIFLPHFLWYTEKDLPYHLRTEGQENTTKYCTNIVYNKHTIVLKHMVLQIWAILENYLIHFEKANKIFNYPNRI